MSNVSPNASAPWPSTAEFCPRRYLVYPLLVAMIALYACWQYSYFVPAYSGNTQAGFGNNQNGYLVTARFIADHGELGFVPEDPYQFVGGMMVMTPPPHSRMYAKYPYGYPLLAAVSRLGGDLAGKWLHDSTLGNWGLYLINPICAILACLLSFFLFRRLVGNFTALMGVLLLACNPITLAYVNEAYSHASTLLCVVAGFVCLLRWWEKGGNGIGFLAGFALGYACAIRYSEFLLVFPLLFAVLARMNIRQYRQAIGRPPWWIIPLGVLAYMIRYGVYLVVIPIMIVMLVRVKPSIRRVTQAIMPLLGWSVPIAVLAITNWSSYGRPWLTGYSLCGEQTGFGLKFFLGNSNPTLGKLTAPNWSTLLFHLNHLGLFLMLSMSLVGLVGLFWHSWRLALMIALWVLPPTALYTFYYWGQGDEDATYYLRFFLTVVPGMLMAGLWALERAVPNRYGARAIAVGLFAALVCGINVVNILPQLEATQRVSLAMRNMADLVHQKFPMNQDNVIFANEATCNQLDVQGGYRLYDIGIFTGGAFNHYNSWSSIGKPDDPFPIQGARSALIAGLLGNRRPDGSLAAKSPGEVDRIAEDLIDQALGRGQRVAFIFRGQTNLSMIRNRSDLKLRELGNWEEPPPLSGGLYTHFRNGKPEFPPPPAPRSTGERLAQTWHIYEVNSAAGLELPVQASSVPRVTPN